MSTPHNSDFLIPLNPYDTYYTFPTERLTTTPVRIASNGNQRPALPSSSSSSKAVRQALGIARDSSEGARDPIVKDILEGALTTTWGKLQDLPNDYIMTRDEFAVFNYFQDRFVGEKIAAAARKRYWDSIIHGQGSNGW